LLQTGTLERLLYILHADMGGDGRHLSGRGARLSLLKIHEVRCPCGTRQIRLGRLLRHIRRFHETPETWVADNWKRIPEIGKVKRWWSV